MIATLNVSIYDGLGTFSIKVFNPTWKPSPHINTISTNWKLFQPKYLPCTLERDCSCKSLITNIYVSIIQNSTIEGFSDRIGNFHRSTISNIPRCSSGWNSCEFLCSDKRFSIFHMIVELALLLCGHTHKLNWNSPYRSYWKHRHLKLIQTSDHWLLCKWKEMNEWIFS